MFTVYYKNHVYRSYSSKNYGNACRRAFRTWIKQGFIKRQPQSLPDGSYKGVSVEYQPLP